jgi:hypothetical protein
MMTFQCIREAKQLPPEWDELAENYYQQTDFLLHAEKYNRCQQRYYLGMDGVKPVSAAIVYSLRLDILTYLKIKSPLKIHIVGIPCSVSSQGIFGKEYAIDALKNYIYKAEKGFVLILNLKDEPSIESGAKGKTFPSVVLSNHFADWQDYTSSLRTGYRRRLRLINQPEKDILFEKKTCSEFTKTMYLQYLEVYKRSSGKLEKLTFDFFRHLPSDFILTVCNKNNEVIGWNIALFDHNTYYFFLGGIDYKENRIYKTYLRLLSSIVRDGIEKRADFIELGQTAEIPKMRMGGKPNPLYMEAHHSNFFFNKLIKLSGKLLEYKRKLENTHSLKQDKA